METEIKKFGKASKEFMIKELADRCRKSEHYIVTNFMGLSTGDIEVLRKELSRFHARYFVVKNSIARVVFKQLSMPTITDMIDGGVGIGVFEKDPIVALKTMIDFARLHDKLVIRGAYLFGETVSVNRVKEIAALPSREVLLARAFAGMKSPISGFVGALGGITRKFVWCIEAIRKQKESK